MVALFVALGAVLPIRLDEANGRGTAMIEVFPGPHALRRAVRHANPGDVLNIHAGTYNEAVKVTKNELTLQGAGTLNPCP